MITARLCKAAESGDIEELKQLLEDGANPNFSQPDRSNRCPIHFAVLEGQVSAVKLLIQHGVSLNVYESSNGWTPLMITVLQVQRSPNYKEIIRLLIENDVDVHSLDYHGNSVIHIAAVVGCPETIELLLSTTDVDCSSPGWGYLSPLHYACECGKLEAAKMLVKYGADIKAVDSIGWTPLHWATLRGHARICVYLCQNDADMNALDFRSQAPLDIAHMVGKYFISDILREQMTKIEQQDYSTSNKMIEHTSSTQLNFTKNHENNISEGLINTNLEKQYLVKTNYTTTSKLFKFFISLTCIIECLVKWASFRYITSTVDSKSSWLFAIPLLLPTALLYFCCLPHTMNFFAFTFKPYHIFFNILNWPKHRIHSKMALFCLAVYISIAGLIVGLISTIFWLVFSFLFVLNTKFVLVSPLLYKTYAFCTKWGTHFKQNKIYSGKGDNNPKIIASFFKNLLNIDVTYIHTLVPFLDRLWYVDEFQDFVSKNKTEPFDQDMESLPTNKSSDTTAHSPFNFIFFWKKKKALTQSYRFMGSSGGLLSDAIRDKHTNYKIEFSNNQHDNETSNTDRSLKSILASRVNMDDTHTMNFTYFNQPIDTSNREPNNVDIANPSIHRFSVYIKGNLFKAENESQHKTHVTRNIPGIPKLRFIKSWRGERATLSKGEMGVNTVENSLSRSFGRFTFWRSHNVSEETLLSEAIEMKEREIFNWFVKMIDYRYTLLLYEVYNTHQETPTPTSVFDNDDYMKPIAIEPLDFYSNTHPETSPDSPIFLETPFSESQVEDIEVVISPRFLYILEKIDEIEDHFFLWRREFWKLMNYVDHYLQPHWSNFKFSENQTHSQLQLLHTQYSFISYPTSPPNPPEPPFKPNTLLKLCNLKKTLTHNIGHTHGRNETTHHSHNIFNDESTHSLPPLQITTDEQKCVDDISTVDQTPISHMEQLINACVFDFHHLTHKSINSIFLIDLLFGTFLSISLLMSYSLALTTATEHAFFKLISNFTLCVASLHNLGVCTPLYDITYTIVDVDIFWMKMSFTFLVYLICLVIFSIFIFLGWSRYIYNNNLYRSKLTTHILNQK